MPLAANLKGLKENLTNVIEEVYDCRGDLQQNRSDSGLVPLQIFTKALMRSGVCKQGSQTPQGGLLGWYQSAWRHWRREQQLRLGGVEKTRPSGGHGESLYRAPRNVVVNEVHYIKELVP